LSDASALRVDAVRALLTTQRYGHSLRVLSETESTNDDAKSDALGGAPEGHVVVAEMQRSGRGSQGRSWSSPAGLDLYVSIVDRPRIAFADLPPLTLAVGLGVADAVDTLLGGARTRVKWPNDVWVDRKKCAGILIEASASGPLLESIVIGIGLNVNRTTFPVDLTGAATSLRLAQSADSPLSRSVALSAVLHHVERWVDLFAERGAAPLVAALDERLAMRGEQARCGDLLGIVRGIYPSGALRFETSAGMREVISGRLLPLDWPEKP
jgi:BirA family biotin operon repressor/biotin-[acetyl-CoA-carboxylase] ligase